MSYIGNQPSTQSYVTDTFSGNGSTTAFTLSIAPASAASLIVAVYGVLQDPSTYGVVGRILTFTGAPPTGTNNISVRHLSLPSSNVTTTAYRTVTDITATVGQTTFATASYTPGFIDVFRNGAKLGAADFTATNGATVVLNNAASAGDLIQTISFYVSSVLNAIPAIANSVNSTFIADSAITTAKLAAGSVTSAKLASTALDTASGTGAGALQLPVGTTAQRPTGVQGLLRYNTDKVSLEFYQAGTVNSWYPIGGRDGSSATAAAPSGYYIAQNYPTFTSGYYWIQSTSMPVALRMYVDMSQEGGGYDFYPITGGISVNSYSASHTGTPLGLDLVIPRSKQHWIAMRNYVSNIIGDTGYTYFQAVTGIYRIGTTTGGTYVSYAMRNPTSYGTGAPDWRAKDGGRWWLRDTAYTEPNGDYTDGTWLGDMPTRGGLPNGYSGQDILFNDGAGGTYATGGSYLVSTNAKP